MQRQSIILNNGNTKKHTIFVALYNPTNFISTNARPTNPVIHYRNNCNDTDIMRR